MHGFDWCPGLPVLVPKVLLAIMERRVSLRDAVPHGALIGNDLPRPRLAHGHARAVDVVGDFEATVRLGVPDVSGRVSSLLMAW